MERLLLYLQTIAIDLKHGLLMLCVRNVEVRERHIHLMIIQKIIIGIMIVVRMQSMLGISEYKKILNRIIYYWIRSTSWGD